MPDARPSLGLTPEELERYVRNVVGTAVVTSEDFLEYGDYVPPAELHARRLAWEAAAALIAANNRRLTEQLRQLGVLAALDRLTGADSTVLNAAAPPHTHTSPNDA